MKVFLCPLSILYNMKIYEGDSFTLVLYTQQKRPGANNHSSLQNELGD